MGRTPAEAFRRLGEAEAAGSAPLSAAVALALAGSDGALRALGAVPARARRPEAVLAALHSLALAGHAPALAAAFAAGDAGAAAVAAVDTVQRDADAVAALLARRRVRTDDTGPSTALYPAVAEAAHRVDADAVGLVALGCGAGFALQLDRVGLGYSDGRTLGDPSSPVRLSARVVGDRPVPARAVPPVVARVGVDPDPVDVTDPDDARWLRACVGPDRRERAARLEAEIALVAAEAPVLLRGDAVDVLPDALARVPAGALPVVITAWTLSGLPPADRPRLLTALESAADHRPVAWASVEGVGVAPAVPTLGDRRASGHSLVGVVVVDGPVRSAEAVGRCWSRGRVLSWLTGPGGPDGGH